MYTIKTHNNFKAVKEIATELYNRYIDYYYSVDFLYFIEIVDNSIMDLYGVCNIEDLHEHITTTYI